MPLLNNDNPIAGLIGNRDLALALLANSRGPNAQSFGQAFGTSMLQADQAQSQRSEDELMRRYREAQIAQLQQPAAPGREYGPYQPGDYTPASWAKFLTTKDPSVLERYTTPRQEFSPSYRSVSRTLPDGSTQQGQFDQRTGVYEWTGAIVPPGTKERVGAEGTAQGQVAGQLAAKAPRAYDTFKTGMASLENAMANTVTGPVMGRLPAFTAAQQTAEGAEATMAPVLKQLFREAGEGTFTDSDQALLMKMVPTRQDHEEARKAKVAMIDAIVRAKLGMGDQPPAPSAGPSGGPAAPKNQAPPAAIEYLRAHPEAAQQFKAKYGYLP